MGFSLDRLYMPLYLVEALLKQVLKDQNKLCWPLSYYELHELQSIPTDDNR